MPILDRVDANVQPFAINSTGTNRTIFGNVTQSDDINDNFNAQFLQGWEFVGVNDAPTKQDFNALSYTSVYLAAYLYQEGIALWNTNQEYIINSYCKGSDGKLYKALTGTVGTPNQGNDPISSPSDWEIFGGTTLTGYKNLLINGDKRVNQRGYADGVLADGVYGYDRWKGADSDANIEQVIEQQNITSGDYTISFTGGGTATVDGNAGLASGDSVSITVSGDVSVKVPKGASNIQLEKGSSATEFELRPLGLELSLCQRYYEKRTEDVVCTTQSGASTVRSVNIFFKARKRAIPTIGNVTVSNGTPSANSIGIDHFYINASVGNTTSGAVVTDWEADSEL